jgi:hypothetical protein
MPVSETERSSSAECNPTSSGNPKSTEYATPELVRLSVLDTAGFVTQGSVDGSFAS